ncbi:MAG: VanZ family protein [Methylobacteriaceae bacterium]|nr:VanZ family protein [Methylobacteriaceae bacterium]
MQMVCRTIAWSLAIGISVLTLVPPGLRPVTGLPHLVEHLAAFVAAGVALALAYRRHVAFLFACAVVWTGALELAQLLVPGRHSRLSDFLVDAAGACAAIGLVAAGSRLAPIDRPEMRR